MNNKTERRTEYKRTETATERNENFVQKIPHRLLGLAYITLLQRIGCSLIIYFK